MTSFVLSHNPQTSPGMMATLSATDISEGLSYHSFGVFSTTALYHPHWMVKVESSADANVLAEKVLTSWRSFRHGLGDNNNYVILALGGRKDSATVLNSPLEQGFWGVDIIETRDPQGFLSSINWNALKETRPNDSVFEVFNYPET